MDTYLTQLREDSIQHEKFRIRSMKAVETRRRNLEAAAKKITVEPITPKAKNTVGTKPWNKYEALAPAVENSRFVKETRTGIRVICDHCGHSFTHFSKNLYSQYFGSCSRCHLNVRLRHYQRG
jgi:delta-aminolevulinic acid dehydratase/porphobilinogen synthase